jgi:predicted glycosyltransferase/peptidoglycan/xylan/chitin deacetylase (PgdA/CDA1 family)
MLSATRLAFLKPFLPRRIQILIRRTLINFYLPSCKDTWPIDKTSAAPPANWQGWPEGKKFALILTHDVETKEGLENCRALMDIDEKHGFRSSFNFVAGDYEVPEELLHEISTRGFEAGIHGLHHTGNIFRSRKVFEEHATKINQYMKQWNVVGFRSPSMYHNLEWLHELKIDYDASTFDTDPFEPQPDGVGTIFPFWVNGNSNQKGYVELPYTLPQDFLLFILMRQKNIDIWKKKLDWIAENGGMALFISHPNYIDFNDNSYYEKYPVQYYEEFLTYIKTKYEGQYWQILPKDMAKFWANKYGRSNMKANNEQINLKKKVWIDLDNSPHVPFFKPIIADLTKQGYPILLTARDCFQVCGLADLAKLKYNKIGRHYGKNKVMKVIGLLIRSFQLISIILKEKPDLAVSHGSRSQVMTAALFNIPTMVIADYEFTQDVVKPSYIVLPEMIPDSAAHGYRKSLFKYPGIKEDVYVPDFKPDPAIMKALGIKDSEILVTIRPPATEAHYHNPESELLFEETINFLGQQPNIRMVILPRNEKKQTAWVKNNWSKWCDSRKIIFPEHVVDGLNLIWFSDFVISGGGTMNREAAALGVPVYSIFRGKIGAVDHYLSENGRLVLLTSPEDDRTKIVPIKRKRAEKLQDVNVHALKRIIEIIKTTLKES